jgi:hypothetical protein
MVTMFLAITDRTWFDLLSAAQPDEVNFWQPSGGKSFRALAPGELFLFKLHSPNDYIVGGGVFSHASNVPLSMAWDAFGAKNGVDDRPLADAGFHGVRHDVRTDGARTNRDEFRVLGPGGSGVAAGGCSI